jgi:hypothetical protein
VNAVGRYGCLAVYVLVVEIDDLSDRLETGEVDLLDVPAMNKQIKKLYNYYC